MSFRDIQKANDPRKITEAFFGQLGSIFGNPMATFGELSQFSPKQYFNLSDFYDTAGQFTMKDYFDVSDFDL